MQIIGRIIIIIMADFDLTLSQPGQESGFQFLSDGRGGISNCGCSEESEKSSSELEKVRSDFESLTDQALYSDMTILVEGRHVPVHRCILAVRSPVWRKVFAEKAKDRTRKSSKVSDKFPPELELSSIVGEGRRIGYAAFKTVMGYVYGGRLRSMSSVVNECRDVTCHHSACRPAIDYAVELLNSASVFDIPELKNLAQVQTPNSSSSSSSWPTTDVNFHPGVLCMCFNTLGLASIKHRDRIQKLKPYVWWHYCNALICCDRMNVKAMLMVYEFRSL